jgi:hypothetical protein
VVGESNPSTGIATDAYTPTLCARCSVRAPQLAVDSGQVDCRIDQEFRAGSGNRIAVWLRTSYAVTLRGPGRPA